MTEAPFERALFGGAVTVAHYGTGLGDASPRAGGWKATLAERAAAHGAEDAVCMRVAFTDAVAEPDALAPLADGVWQTVDLADGVVVARPGRAAAIQNADCAIGVLWDGRAAVPLHLGLNCLWRADGGPTVLERAVQRLAAPAAEQRFWVGCGIGPCCHGYDHSTEGQRRRAAELRRDLGQDVLGGEVRWGPRRGQIAYDHVLMAARLAERLGVGQVEAERRCRSCAGMPDPDGPGYGLWFSNTRDAAGTRERNLGLVVLRG